MNIDFVSLVDVIKIVDIAVSWGPTALFVLIILCSFLTGLRRGLRKSLILMLQAIGAAIICIAAFFIFLNSKFYLETIQPMALDYVLSAIDSMGFGKAMVIVLKDNGEYILTLIDFAARLVLALALLIVYWVLDFILYIIYCIFYSERKYRKKKTQAFLNNQTDRTYKKHRWYGGLIGLFRGIVSGIICLSFLGGTLYVATGGIGDKKMEEYSFGNEGIDMGYEIYRSIDGYGTTGIYKVLNAFKDTNDQPYYLFAADLVFSGRLTDEDLGVDERVIFREEIGEVTGFATDTINLLLKYGGDEMKEIINGNGSADMDFIVEVMCDPGFKVEFKELILDFDSKTYFINLTYSLINTVIANLDELELTESIGADTAEMLKILFTRGHLSTYIPDEAEILDEQKQARRYANSEEAPEKEEVIQPYINLAHLIKKEDVLVVYDAIIELIEKQNNLGENEELDTLETIKDFLPKIKQLSLFTSERRDEFDPVFTRLFCFIDNRYLTLDGEVGSRYEDIIDEKISIIQELTDVVDFAIDVITLYQNIYVEGEEILDTIMKIFDQQNEKYEENYSLFNKSVDTLTGSRLLGKVLGSGLVVDAIKEGFSSISGDIYLSEDMAFENKYDKDGNVIRYGELHNLLHGIKIIGEYENEKKAEGDSLLDSLLSGESEDPMELINDIIPVLLKEDEVGKTLTDYLVDSDLLRSVISGVLISSQGEGMPFYIPQVCLEVNSKNERVNLINKKELKDILVSLDDILEVVDPLLEKEEFTNQDINDLLTNETVERLLNNKIIEATFANVLVMSFKGRDDIIIPEKLEDVENWISVTGTGELKMIFRFFKDSGLDFNQLMGNSEDGSEGNGLDLSILEDEEVVDMLLDSQILHYTVSNILLNSKLDMGTFKLIIPSSSQTKLPADSTRFVVIENEIKVLCAQIATLGITSGETPSTSQMLIKFVGNKENILSSNIISASLINFLVSDDAMNDILYIDQIGRLKQAGKIENLNNYSSSNPWYNELRYLIDALDEILGLSAKGEDAEFELTDEELENSISTLLETLNDPSAVNPDRTKLEVCYDSEIIKKNMTDRLDQAIGGTVVAKEDLPALKNGDEYYSRLEFESLSKCMEIFDIDIMDSGSNSDVADKVADKFSTFNEPLEDPKFEGKTTLQIIGDSRIVMKVFTVELDKTLTDSLIEPDVKAKIKGSDDIFEGEEIENLVNSIGVFGVESLNDFETADFNSIASFNEQYKDSEETKLQVVMKSQIMGGILTKAIKDNTSAVLKHHDKAYEEDINIYKEHEIAVLIDLLTGENSSVDSIQISDINLSDIKELIYHEDTQETESYLLTSTISYQLMGISGIVIPRLSLDADSLYDDQLIMQPSELVTFINSYQALVGSDQNDAGNWNAEFEIPSTDDEEKFDRILESRIMRATITDLVRKENSEESTPIYIHQDNLEDSKYVVDSGDQYVLSSDTKLIIVDNQMSNLIETFNILGNSDWLVPSINSVEDVMLIMVKSGGDFNKLLNADPVRYRIATALISLVDGYNFMNPTNKVTVVYENVYDLITKELTEDMPTLSQGDIIKILEYIASQS